MRNFEFTTKNGSSKKDSHVVILASSFAGTFAPLHVLLGEDQPWPAGEERPDGFLTWRGPTIPRTQREGCLQAGSGSEWTYNPTCWCIVPSGSIPAIMLSVYISEHIDLCLKLLSWIPSPANYQFYLNQREVVIFPQFQLAKCIFFFFFFCS